MTYVLPWLRNKQPEAPPEQWEPYEGNIPYSGVTKPATWEQPAEKPWWEFLNTEQLVKPVLPQGAEENEWMQRLGEMASVGYNLAANIIKKPLTTAILPTKLAETGLKGMEVTDKAFAQGVTQPFRSETYSKWAEENPVGSTVLEFAAPIGWIIPGGRANKGANILEDATKLLRKGIKAEEIFKVLTETAQAGKKFAIPEAQELIRNASINAKKLGLEIPAHLANAGIKDANQASQIQSVIDKLRKPLEEASDAVKKTGELRHVDLQKKAAKLADALKDVSNTDEIGKAYTALQGAMSTVGTKSLKQIISEADNKILTSLINNNPKLQPFEKANTIKALAKLIEGNVDNLAEAGLQKNEIKKLEKVLGFNLADLINTKPLSLARNIWENIWSVANLPRSLMASGDMSWLLRQGAPLAISRPKIGLASIKPSVKAALSDNWTREAESAMKSTMLDDGINAYQKLVKDGKLRFSALMGDEKIAKFEEAFMTKFSKKIPIVWQSEKSYITGLNKLRMDTAAVLYNKMLKAVGSVNDAELKKITNLVNLASGWGKLGKLEEAAPILNALFFSPRLLASRFQLPYAFISGSVPRVEAAKMMAAWAGFDLTVIGLLTAAGMATVETDPRSSDFMKIKMGKTRLDPWAGYQPYARFLAQMITGERKATSTGGVYPINRMDTAVDFARTKLNPIVGFVTDLMDQGKNMIGEKIDLSTIEGVGKQAYDRLTSLAIQDMVDAFVNEGFMGVLAASPATLGWGAQTYPNIIEEKFKQLGQKDDKGKVYTMSNYGGDISRYGFSAESRIPLVSFYWNSKKDMEKYDKVSIKDRVNFRKNNPEIDAKLYFWGRLETLQSNEAGYLVGQWINQYNVPQGALKSPVKPSTKTSTPSQLPSLFTPNKGSLFK